MNFEKPQPKKKEGEKKMKLMEVLAFQGYQLCIGGSSTQTETRGWSTKPFSGQAHRQVQKTAECGILI